MATFALVLYLLLLGVVFGVRSWTQRRATGSSGYRGISGRPGSLEWLGGVLFIVALALGLAAPIAELAHVLDPATALDDAVVGAAGAALAVIGAGLTIAAQHDMGRSWRVGVDEQERTDLVTGGAFAVARNPFFAALMLTAVGLLLMVPNVLAILALLALVAAAEIQVRLVEEPALLRQHGDQYADYARRVGRFVPGVGRLG